MSESDTRRAELAQALAAAGLADVEVEVDGDIAILTGPIEHGDLRSKALEICRARGIHEVHDQMHVDVVDRASIDSFPASDPPSYTR